MSRDYTRCHGSAGCYGPYKQDSTNGQKGPRRVKNQCARCGTDGTSGTMGRGVAESHDTTQYVSLWGRGNVTTYRRTEPLLWGGVMYLKTAVLTFR